MPMCAAPHAPAVLSITKCTPSSLAVLLAPVLPGSDLPTSSRKVVGVGVCWEAKGSMWRRRGSKRKERFPDPWLAVVRSADPPGISVLYKILPGKDYRKPTGNCLGTTDVLVCSYWGMKWFPCLCLHAVFKKLKLWSPRHEPRPFREACVNVCLPGSHVIARGSRNCQMMFYWETASGLLDVLGSQ